MCLVFIYWEVDLTWEERERERAFFKKKRVSLFGKKITQAIVFFFFYNFHHFSFPFALLDFNFSLSERVIFAKFLSSSVFFFRLHSFLCSALPISLLLFSDVWLLDVRIDWREGELNSNAFLSYLDNKYFMRIIAAFLFDCRLVKIIHDNLSFFFPSPLIWTFFFLILRLRFSVKFDIFFSHAFFPLTFHYFLSRNSLIITRQLMFRFISTISFPFLSFCLLFFIFV